VILVLVPRVFSDPRQLDASIGSDFDGGCLRCRHRLLDRLHEILGWKDREHGQQTQHTRMNISEAAKVHPKATFISWEI